MAEQCNAIVGEGGNTKCRNGFPVFWSACSGHGGTPACMNEALCAHLYPVTGWFISELEHNRAAQQEDRTP